MADAVAPVVVVRQPPQRSLDSADHHRHVREQFLEAARVHGRRVVGSPARGGARRVRVARAPLLRGGVVIDHRVHVAARHAEEEPRAAAGREVGQPARLVPAGLADDADLESARGEQARDQGDAERRVIDVGVAVDQDDVELFPPSPPGVVQRHREVCLRSGTRRRPAAARADLDEAGHPAFITAGPM